MLDQRDQKVTLFSGQIEVLPEEGDFVGLFNVDDVFGGWIVDSRSLALALDDDLELREEEAWVVILQPAEEGEWAGSANDYLEALGWLDSTTITGNQVWPASEKEEDSESP